jgi:Tfp pilus assembly protein PilF
LQEAMELDTASEAPLILGLMWLQQGRYREAKVMLEKFLHPDSFLAARVRLLIENIQRKQGEP